MIKNTNTILKDNKMKEEINLVKSIEYNTFLCGYILTLYDNRIVQIQFDRCDNVLSGSNGLYFPEIDYINNYDLDINEEEEKRIKKFIDNNDEIMKTALKLDNLWEQSEDDLKYKELLIENGLLEVMY